MYLSPPESQLLLPGAHDFYNLMQGRTSLLLKSNFRMVMRSYYSKPTEKNDFC